MTGSRNISYVNFGPPRFLMAHVAAVVLVTLTLCLCIQAQESGSIKGTVRVASGAAAAGIVVIATNQITGKWRRTRSSVNGVYSLRLSAGAYRVSVAAPHLARFDKDKNYGEFAVARGATLENVIVEAGKETVVDISLDQEEVKEIP